MGHIIRNNVIRSGARLSIDGNWDDRPTSVLTIENCEIWMEDGTMHVRPNEYESSSTHVV